MNEPTEEQIQWVWEQCAEEVIKDHEHYHYKFAPDNGVWYEAKGGFPVDLNNLFKYAVPIWIQSFGHSGGGQVAYRIFTPLFEVLSEQGYQRNLADLDKKFALALFWAIYKSLGGK